ncbi:MAG: threonylcarbamoyl-AMP synthase [Saprospiraceae bacterium]|nr:threonylcarbamoyl-AMP synthase [Candidatus Vicinibacter proximus]MBL7822056.1 threonylcarbamoyl-AMP synthase [Saprospiraceae bacterium]MCC6842659.1 threonylcarbamoyl-AMP synthase [Saprospiraceae bacterium]
MTNPPFTTTTGTDIGIARDFLQNDELVAIPTETVYGLAGNALKPETIRKIFETKNRPTNNPLILHAAHIEQIKSYVIEWPAWADTLAAKFWPGPLTLLLRKNENIPYELTAGSAYVAVRIPDHTMTLELLKSLPFPLAAPSANPFTYISPTTAEHVFHQLEGKIPYILDGGPCRKGLESTIVGESDQSPCIYRLGAIDVESIEQCIGPVKVKNKAADDQNLEAPGMLMRHYSPSTPFLLTDNVHQSIAHHPGKKIGCMVFGRVEELPEVAAVIVLSGSRNLSEAAQKIYESMHALDRMQLDLIIAERMPDEGLGQSINDRLERAHNVS